MNLIILFLGFLLFVKENSVGFIKFSPESLSDIPILAKKGKTHLESLKEKANVPHFGPCWKNAISDLQTGCKFLSENVQSDLAFKFTDCFFQMSGHEPLKCDIPKSVCLKKLSDRAFNAYTEFYTHTQSICYFLQSQIWHEETEKTIDKLSSTSVEVSQKLEEAEKIQEQLLKQQKESLILQNDLVDNSKIVATFLQSSQDKINLIMKDFQDSANKQRELLLNVFEHLLSFKAWVVDELSWFNSTIFFIGATIMSFLFTSIARTRGARMLLFIIFAVNFLFERFLSSSSCNDILFLRNLTSSTKELNSLVWLSRNFCCCLSVVILLYFAFNYFDYNYLNHELLLEIKNQNSRILNYFNSQGSCQYKPSSINNVTNSNCNLKKWTGNEKSLYLDYGNKILNSKDAFCSSKANYGTSTIKSYNRGFESVDSPTFSRTHKQNFSVTAPDDMSTISEDHKTEDNISIKSEKKSIDSFKKCYDLRVKRKTVYAF